MWKRLGMAGPLSVLAVVFAMAMAASGVGTHVILAQGDDDVESTPACTERYHSGITQDCANVLGFNNGIMWGASTTTMSQVVDEVWVWSKGVEVCLTPTPDFCRNNGRSWKIGGLLVPMGARRYSAVVTRWRFCPTTVSIPGNMGILILIGIRHLLRHAIRTSMTIS